tara:strand:- start:190 stop:711 length:522 start_codon:yes stop_codon:yes gene_type:complete
MTISSVTSEALQAKLRELLPSQQGFSTDISASDTIIPIIDLTEAAEGSSVAQNLQTAWDFSTGSATVSNTTTTVINNTGFWKIDYVFTSSASGAATKTASISINDGAATKVIWKISQYPVATNAVEETKFVFLRAGDSLEVFSSDSASTVDIVYRQVADVNGRLTNPLGFTPQ